MIYIASADTYYYLYASDDVYYQDTSDDEGSFTVKFTGVDNIQGNILWSEYHLYFYDVNKNFATRWTSELNASQNWTESNVNCSILNSFNSYGSLNSTDFVKDDHRYYVWNVTGDATKGIKRAYANGDENITMYTAMDGGGTCYDIKANAYMRSKAYPNGKTLYARGHTQANAPVLVVVTDYDPCAYESGDWEIDCSLDCEYDTETINIDANSDIILTGSGIVKFVDSLVLGFDNVLIQNYCQAISINTGWVGI